MNKRDKENIIEYNNTIKDYKRLMFWVSLFGAILFFIVSVFILIGRFSI